MCKVDGCSKQIKAIGLCSLHLHHKYKYGEFRKPRKEMNEYLDKGDYLEIVIYDKNLKPKVRTKISKDDYEKVKDIKWMHNGQYIKKATSKFVLYLHHTIMGKPEKGFVIDHINLDKLDNRRENLRFITKADNNRNKLAFPNQFTKQHTN